MSAPLIRWRARWDGKVESKEFTRETESFLFYMDRGRERREAKVSRWDRWFDTEKELLESIAEARAVKEAEAAKRRIRDAAPDLLAALQGVLRVADRATDEFDAARAAIAKATGEAA